MYGYQASTWYDERKEEALALADKYELLAEETRQMLARVREDQQKARVELAAAYLPQLSEAGLSRLEQLTGFKGLSRRHPIKAMERERATLQRRVAQILADEKYQRRQWLVGPQGELTQGRAEAWELFEPWQKEAAGYEDLDGFMDLIDSAYDTPEFEHNFWEPSYWRRWAAGDRICEQLGEDDFGDDVLPKYRRVAAERDKWKAEVARWDARIQEIHDLVREHDQAVARIPQLPQIYLAHSHDVIAAFLDHADLGLLDQWSRKEEPPDRAVRMNLRIVAGLEAKEDILEEILEQGLARMVRDFKTRANKYARKVAKYNRSKHYHRRISQREIDQNFVSKQPKYDERTEKLRKLLHRIESYDDYGRFDLDNDPELWWVEITRKNPSSAFTPKLRRWYDRNQGRRPRHDTSLRLEEAVAGAVAEAVGQDDDLGYLS